MALQRAVPGPESGFPGLLQVVVECPPLPRSARANLLKINELGRNSVKVIAKTDEYTIYQKRSERYGVKDANRNWVNGDAKVAILLEHKLIEAPVPKAPEPEVEEAAEEAVEAEASADEAAADEASEEEAPAEETPAEDEEDK